MAVLKHIGVLSAGKISALASALIGLILGLLLIIVGSIFGASLGASGIFAGLGFFSLLTLPIIYGFMGFILGVVGTLFYNIVASWVGGLEIEIVEGQFHQAARNTQQQFQRQPSYQPGGQQLQQPPRY